MEGISDIKIVALDSKRPPAIRAAPYIDLFFELSHEVPRDWSVEFNALMSKHKPPAKIQTDKGQFIETWVRTPDDVVKQFELLKAKVAECNDIFTAIIMARLGRKNDANSSLENQPGEQGRLNRIVAGLKFED